MQDRFADAVVGRAVAGARNRRRAERAMEAVRAHLVRRDAQLVLLLTPPFDRTAHDPGYIKGYLPGIRENGGQYTHAALWTVIALARLGLGDEAMELFHMLNPINHTRTAEGVERYRAEPYAVAADVYAHPMHVGRGGWTWYTGSAGWMYQAAIEGILGLRREGSTFAMNPCIPAMWPAFAIEWKIGRTRYRITVTNPEHRCRRCRVSDFGRCPSRSSRDSADRGRRYTPRRNRPRHRIGRAGAAGITVEMAGRIREPADLWLRRFTARYASVPRFVVMLRGTSPPEARAVITTAPGEEGQVD